MTETNEPTPVGCGCSPVRTVFVLLGVAWFVWLLGLGRAAWIDAQFVGPGDDVTDSLRRSGYIAERVWAFDAAALVADAAACVALLAAKQPSGWGVLAWVLLMPPVLLHGLAFLVSCILAG